MNFNIKPSFERIYNKLPLHEKQALDIKIAELFDFYSRRTFFAGLRVRKISIDGAIPERDTLCMGWKKVIKKWRNVLDDNHIKCYTSLIINSVNYWRSR